SVLGCVWQHQDSHRKALGIAQPALVGGLGRQLAGRRFVALTDAPADAGDPAVEQLAGQKVEGDRYVLPRFDVAKLVLPHVGGDPPWAPLEEAEQRLARAHISSWRQAQMGEHPVSRRDDGRHPQIYPALLGPPTPV